MPGINFEVFASLSFFFTVLVAGGYSHYRYRQRNNMVYKRIHGDNYYEGN